LSFPSNTTPISSPRVSAAWLRVPAFARQTAALRTAAFKGRWLEEEREKRNGAPTRRRGKEQSLRRLRRTCPTGAQFCLDERLAAAGARRRPMVWPCHYSSAGGVIGPCGSMLPRTPQPCRGVGAGQAAPTALSLTAEIPLFPRQRRGKGRFRMLERARNDSSRFRLEGVWPLPFVSLAL
jgi:hypothetical protein